MPLTPLGVLDLSIVTDRLIQILNDAWTTSPLWATLGAPGPTFSPSVSGSMPESVRKDGGCQLCVYLFHVTEDKFHRNSPVIGPRAVPIPEQPLGLQLSYLVTAFADKNYVQEQQAMSIAARAFYDQPIVKMTVAVPVPPLLNIPVEFTLTMEQQSSDELSRLWQSISAPFRLSLAYKVGVVFVTPPAPASGLAPPVKTFSVAAAPSALPFAENGYVTGTQSSLAFLSPETGEARSYEASPALVPLGKQLVLQGANLNLGASFSGPPPNPGSSYRVFLLLPPDYRTEHEVTSWKVPDTDPAHPNSTSSGIVLAVPPSVGALPGNAPPPGIYQLRAGSATALGDKLDYRTNATPFSIAPFIDVAVTPPNPPLLSATAGAYTLHGAGFIAGSTELLLGNTPLAEDSTPGNGRFQIDAAGKQITWQAPLNLTGRQPVRVRVNQVESPPSWWVVL